jgi:enoyl-CoA hydratase
MHEHKAEENAMNQLVHTRREGAASVITLDDGKVNVLSVTMFEALNAALDRAQADQTVVVITGRAGVFSAGFDLAVFKHDKAEVVAMLTAGAKLTERLLSHPAPVVVACNGHAIAMGVFILLSADYRIGIAGAATRTCANEVAIGLTLPRFAIEVCRQRLHPGALNCAAVLAEVFTPEQAVTAGFLDALVPAEELMRVALQKAEAFAKLDRASHTATKLRVREQALKSLRAAIVADVEDWNSRTGRETLAPA